MVQSFAPQHHRSLFNMYTHSRTAANNFNSTNVFPINLIQQQKKNIITNSFPKKYSHELIYQLYSRGAKYIFCPKISGIIQSNCDFSFVTHINTHMYLAYQSFLLCYHNSFGNFLCVCNRAVAPCNITYSLFEKCIVELRHALNTEFI